MLMGRPEDSRVKIPALRLFDEHLSQNVTESNRRSDFCKAMIDKLVTFSFADAFSQKYDFFATIFEYLIKDYNKDFGKDHTRAYS